MNIRTWAGVAMAILLAACAASVTTLPVQFTPAAQTSGSTGFKVLKATEVRLPTGFTRKLAAGSRWSLSGQVPQGQVYRPVDSVFSIEGRQIHEAWLVVDKSRLVGFYLVGENAYSPLDLTVLLPTETLP